ncbi:interferon-induced very large GTPase 1-like [Mya arenaria]|uniref:interferon-induced very large GTPase 1-like n=1 Tax=Mya arenaria TaxID=6604 RepID=UPI0022E6842B|nr:interferon-induced very large GTPase 1-like [Mya arenaria]
MYEFIEAKRKTKISEQKHGDYEHVLEVLDEEIETTSFTVQHFFREISQICNSIIEFDVDRSIAGVSLDEITKVYANLISRGATIELIDGDNPYMASYWNQAVFEYIEKHKSVGKCVILSILGLQGTGKSTMLNCMFGLNFETGTGRCTRGINGRLLKMEISSNDNHGHVFVVDSEGLRAPERSITDQNNFDNELATFITGIGHVSLMNVSGENPSELHNVLGVVVYALIRLKHAENALLEGQSCMFVHHGVADVTAHQNNLDALTKVLDQVTKVAAKSEHMYFNDVIKFNAISQVFYTPEFLQGNVPATRINPEYSKIVSTVRHRIIQLLVEQGRGLDMTDIGIRTENVWDGVKSENFIFSFRNGVEIKIYHDINNALNDKLWNFEKELNFHILPRYQRKYQGCVTKDDLSMKHKPIFESAMEICESKRQEVEGSIEELFEKGEDSRTAVEWKFSELLVVKQKLQDIMNAAKNRLNSYYTIQFLYIETSTITEERKKQLEIKSQEVAEKLIGECSEKDIEDSFKTLWEKFEEDIRQKLTVMRPRNLDEMFKSKLLQIYSEDTMHIKNHLKAFTAIESLHHVLRDNPDVEPLVQYVESSVKGFDETEEVSEIIVYDFIRKIKAKCSEAKTKKDRKLTKMFSINFVVESSRFALYHFRVHNKLFQKKQGIDSYIRQYREKIYLSFKVTIGGKQKEKQICKSLCSTILFFLNKAIKMKIERIVKTTIEEELCVSKANLLLEICTFLAKETDELTAFDNFISYLMAPDSFGKKWLIIRCEQILFPEVQDKKSFKEISKRTIDIVFGFVNESLKRLKNHSEVNIRLQKAVDLFSQIIESLDIDSTDIESVCHSEMNELVNVKDLANYIEPAFDTERESLRKTFCSVTVNTIETFINLQYDALFKHLWGCFEKCPFCKEPCSLRNHSIAAKHQCKQHRILGCLGVKTEWKTFYQAPCDSSINTYTEWFDCQIVNYVCKNHQNHGNSQERHLFRKYKTFFPHWDIIPSSDVRESSTYWKWFMYRFRERLCEYYGFTSDGIPDNWSYISAHEAIQSLRLCYS